jgi:hypothetical protein
MGSKDLFFEVEQCYNAPLTTGQINELETRKMRHVSTGGYPAPNQNAAILPAPTAPSKRENKVVYLAIYKCSKDDTPVFLIKKSKQQQVDENNLQNALNLLKTANPDAEYRIGLYRATASEIAHLQSTI